MAATGSRAPAAPAALSAQEQAAQDALRSEPEDNFKRYVLYVLDKDANSDKALVLLKKSPRLSMTVVQDVAAVPKPRPAWLVSVPTLVDRHEEVVKRGSEALKQLGEWALLAPPASAAKPRGYLGGTSAFSSKDD